jgi:hypothetical protein
MLKLLAPQKTNYGEWVIGSLDQWKKLPDGFVNRLIKLVSGFNREGPHFGSLVDQ